MRVYGGWLFIKGSQVRCLVATTSQQNVATITKQPMSFIRAYWAITGNKEEIELAMKKPESLIITE